MFWSLDWASRPSLTYTFWNFWLLVGWGSSMIGIYKLISIRNRASTRYRSKSADVFITAKRAERGKGGGRGKGDVVRQPRVNNHDHKL